MSENHESGLEAGYDYQGRKVVAVLASDLGAGTAMNVMGHLSVSLGAYADGALMGRHPLLDGSGVEHTGIARYPIIVTKVKRSRLRRLIDDARGTPGLLLCDYPEEMLATGHDDELADALAGRSEESLSYLGAVLYGESSEVDRLTGKFTLWR
ncbi:DUF2000 domain-containing protein [Streptosporangium algeriense]|uniref:DUF2000 domain-containing protein n=1 Tax=Streptosporangium algeriense TaxID=1682748 RepID=A0ABW3E4U8_9ACTN